MSDDINAHDLAITITLAAIKTAKMGTIMDVIQKYIRHVFGSSAVALFAKVIMFCIFTSST